MGERSTPLVQTLRGIYACTSHMQAVDTAETHMRKCTWRPFLLHSAYGSMVLHRSSCTHACKLASALANSTKNLPHTQLAPLEARNEFRHDDWWYTKRTIDWFPQRWIEGSQCFVNYGSIGAESPQLCEPTPFSSRKHILGNLVRTGLHTYVYIYIYT